MTEETKIKKQVKGYLNMRGIFNYHILQGLGAFKGIPDRGMHYQGKVVYLEIKAPNGKQSDEQKKFQAQCEADGIKYLLVRGLEDVINFLGNGDEVI